MHNHISFNYLPWVEKHSRKSPHTPLSTAEFQSTKTPWTKLKNPRNLKKKGFLHGKPCMHERKLPRGSIKPWLKEGSHCIPLEALTMENNLKEKMNSAGILWKRYQKKSWEMGKGLMHSKLQLDQRRSNMQEGKSCEEGLVLTSSQLVWNGLKKKKKGSTRGFHF